MRLRSAVSGKSKVSWWIRLKGLSRRLPICMGMTFQISGKNYDKYNASNVQMNSNIVEYVEGIEVIKAFGRTGVSYEKYAFSIQNCKTFVVKWMSSTWVSMKLAFALFPSTLLGVLPVGLWLGASGRVTVADSRKPIGYCPL